MISYDNYKNRIEKLAKFKRILHKFRFLICGVLALIVGASVGLMVAKGSYTSGMSLSAQSIMFNEEYEVTAAKAFLASASEQHIEYRGEEGDWTREKPVKAGKYSARTVTKKIVGYNYSPEVSFEIVPLAAEFIITADSVTYGDIPKYSLPQLVSGHRVDESVLEFDYAEYGAAVTEVKVNADTLKIIDANREDFTNCYDLAEPQGKELTIGKRKINVTPVSYEFIYDAQPHYTGGDVTEDTQERLVAGDTLTVTTSVSALGTTVNGAVNAGKYTVNIQSASISHDGKDISNWYDIINRASGLTVTARPLTITTGDAQKVYDGTPAVNTEFTYDNLIDGHTINVNTSTLPANSKVGQHKNAFGVNILDGTKDVTDNYKVSCNAGTLTITPATLAVTTATPAAHVYDGNNFTDYTFEVADKDKLGSDFEFAAAGSLATDTKDAGEYVNKFDIAVYLNGVDVTDNFEISYVYGKLTVTKRALTVTTVGGSKVYDGEAFTYGDVYGDDLAENQTLKEVTPFSVINVTSAEGVTIAAEFTVIDQSQRDVGKNYEISYSHGSLIIEPLKISVRTVDASREYDGTPFSNAECEITRLNADGTGLYGTDYLFPIGITSRTVAGSEDNVCRYQLPTFDGVRSNYQIVGEIEYGTLTVEPKKVTVTINDAEAVYGESIPQNGFILSYGELPNNEELTFTTHYEKDGVIRTPETWEEIYTLLDAGAYLIVQNDDKQITGGNASVDNYEFTFVAGILEIKQRVIYYVTADDTKIYDGTKLYNTGYETYLLDDGTKAGLLNGDELNLLEDPTSVVQVQKRPNANYYTEPNNNYYIDNSATIFGWLEVTPRPIIVYTGSDSKLYDGTPLTNEDYTVKYAVEADGEWVADDSEVGLIAGDELTLKGLPVSITNAGEAKNANRFENGNYSIKAYVDGTLEITKKRIDIKIYDHKDPYGDDLQYAMCSFNDFGWKDGTEGYVLLTGNYYLGLTFGFKKDGKILQSYPESDWGLWSSLEWRLPVGTYSIYAAEYLVWEKSELSYTTVDSDILKNYEIYCDEGTQTITPRKVDVTINDGTAVYGDDVSAKEYGFVTNPAELPYGEQLTLTYKYDRKVKDVGEYDILEDKCYIDGKEEGTNNYDFTFNNGTLKITPKAIYTYFKAKSCEYGEDLPDVEWWISYGNNVDTENVPVTEFPYGDTVELVGFLYYKLENREPCGWHRDNPRLNAGKYIVDYNSWDIRNTDGDRCNDNYDVFSGFNHENILTVTPAPLKVTLADITGVVYGDEITYPAEQTIVEGLKYNQTLSFEVRYEDEDGKSVVPKDAGEYGIFLDEDTYEVTEEDGAEGLISNYTLAIENSTLTIGKKQVNIKLHNETYRYGREDLLQGATNYEYVRVNGKTALEYGEELWIWVGYKKGGVKLNKDVNNHWRLEVGDYTRYAVEYYIKDGEDGKGIDVAHLNLGEELKNYEITCEEGALEITPYTVTVKPNDQTCVYGTPEDEIEDKGFVYDSWTVNHGGLPYGENLILSYTYDPSPVTDVGTYTIKATATGVEDGDLKNYEVSYEDGTLTVEALEIYVALNDTNKTEYGTAPKDTGYKVYLDAEKTKKYTLSDGEEFKADYEYYKFDDADKTTVTVRNVGYYGIKALNARIETSDGETSGNYTVNVIDGKLTVYVKHIDISLIRVPDVYYGESLSYPSGIGNYNIPTNPEATSELAYGEKLEVVAYYTRADDAQRTRIDNPTKAGAYRLHCKLSDFKVYESDGVTLIENGVDNYKITHGVYSGVLYIKPLEIAVSPLEYTQANGNALQYGDLPSFSYPDYLGNYKGDILSEDGSVIILPYGERLKITQVIFKHKDGITFWSTLEDSVGLHQIAVYRFETYDKDGNLIEDGDDNYSLARLSERKASTFEIVPRKISIQLSSYEMEYGDFEEFDYPDRAGNYDIDNSDPLVYGQTLEVGFNREFIYKQLIDGEYKEVTPKDVGTYLITFKEGDYCIYDGEETYWDGSYDVTFIPGTLTIRKKQIHIYIDNQSCTYGESLPENSYVIKDSEGEEYVLPYGDEFTIQGYKYCDYYASYFSAVTPKNVGIYKIFVNDGKVINGGDDVTINYTILQISGYGTLTINKADLEITLPDITGMKYGDEWTYPYDGIQISGLKYSEDLEVAVKFTDGDGNIVEEPKNAGTYTVVLDEDNCKLTNQDGTDGLLSNYEIDCVDGVINIEKRAIKVNFKKDYFDIDYGDPLPELEPFVSEKGSDEEYTLPYKEEITFGYTYLNLYTNEYETPKNVGLYEVQINRVYIDGVSQTNASCNYLISYGAHGEPWIKIWEKIVKPTIKDFTKVYGETISYEFACVDEKDENGNEFFGYGESVKFIVRYLQDGKEVTPVNKGVYDIEIVEYIVYDENGVEITNGADNYDFRPDCGQMTIAALEVTITVNDLTATYGEGISELENGFTVDTEMPFGEEFELSYSCDLDNPNVGEHKNAITAKVDGVSGGNESLDNYDIKEVIAGKLTVVAREITVTVNGGTAVYGYEELPEIKHEITVGAMVSGEKLVPAYKFSLNGTECEPVNVGEYDIEVDKENTTVEGGNASYGNYAVTYIYEGQLVISRAPLTVEITGNSFVYGDNGLNVTFEITEGELYHEDSLKLTYEYINKESGDKTDDPTVAGTYAITATAEIVGGNARVENYDITYEDDPEPTLTILKRGVEVKLNKGEVNAFTYGDDYGAEICNAEITDAVSGHTITVAVTYAKKEESGASAARAFRARAFSARTAETFIPKDAGTYIASLDFANCTVTDADGNPVEGGIDNYELSTACDDVEFAILPMALTVTVKNAEITYGDKLPTALEYTVTQEMPYGESLELTFSFADENDELPVHKGDYAVSVTGVSVNGGSLDNYKPEYTNENPTLKIKAKSVTVTLKDLSVSYGAEVKYKVEAGNYVSAYGFLSGDELTVTKVYYKGADGKVYDEENPPANVGTYAIVYDGCSIVNADGEDASGDYAVTGEDGVLVIDSSLITVYTATPEAHVYDGKPLSTEEYDHYDGDLGDYRLVVDKDNICEQIDVTDGEGVDNTTKFKIVDADGNETQNLKLQYGTYGKLIVTPRSARITISDTTAVYGEKPEIGHTAVGLVDGEDVEFEVEYDEVPVIDGDRFILPVGGYLMNYKEGTATIVGGRGLASNYDLTFDYDAFFEVTARHIAITTADGSKEYNGTAFSKTDGYTTEWVVDGARQGAVGLLGEDTLTVGDFASLIEKGSCENACTYTVSDNYFIEEDMYAYGTLTVTARTVTAKTADIDETYNGEAYSDDEVTDVDGKLAEGHEFRVTSALVSRTDVCEDVENVLTVIIVDTNDGDKDVTANYTLNYDYGKITISPRLLKITTGGKTVAEYDGTAYGNTDYAEAEGLLTDLGHGLAVDTAFTYTNATVGVDNKTTYKVYDGDVDISGNYDIQYTYGKIVIGKKAVIVTLNGGVQVEYGDGSYKQQLTENAVELVNGETAEIEITTDRAVGGKGTYTATADWTKTVIKNAEGKIIADGKDNYSVTTSSVDFEVIPRTVTVTLNKGGKTEFVYGEDYKSAIRTAKADSMVDGEVINAAVTYSETDPKDVGEYTATLDVENCTVVGGNRENYIFVDGGAVTFNIVAKVLTVYMNDLTVAFNEPLEYPAGDAGYYDVDGLEYGETLTAVKPAFEKNGVRVTPVYAGEYDVVCFTITVNGGEVDSKNYSVKTGKPYGKLTIEGINISIERLDVEKIYDGAPLELPNVATENEINYFVDDGGSNELPAGYTIELAEPFATQDGNVSSSRANEAKYIVLDENGEIARNYVITYVKNDAMLTIKPLPVTVEIADMTKVYGEDLEVNKYKQATLLNNDKLLYKVKIYTQEGELCDTSKPLDVGTYVIKGNDSNMSFSGGAKGSNYSVSFAPATLTVNKRGIIVTTPTASAEYSGSPFSETEGYTTQWIKDGVKQKEAGLLGTDKLTPVGTPASQTEIGSCRNECEYAANENYEIVSYVYGKLTVTQKVITVTTGKIDEEYSGTAHTNGEFSCDTELPAGYTMERAGELIKFVNVTENGENVFDVKIKNAGGEDVTGNYDIHYDYGTVNITPADLEITLGETEDGENEFNYGDGTFETVFKNVTTEGLVTGDNLTTVALKYATEDGKAPVNAGKYTVRFDDENSVISYAGEGNRIGNYNVICKPVEFTILRKTVTLTLGSWDSEEYDGNEHVYATDGCELVTDLFDGESLAKVVVSYSTEDGKAPVDAGNYHVFIDTDKTTVSAGGAEIAIGTNYEVTCEPLEFEITPKTLKITFSDVTHTYDGTEFDFAASEGFKTNLCEGDEIKRSYKYDVESVRNVGTYTVTFDGDTIEFTSGLASNYEFDNAKLADLEAKLKVTPCEITVTVADRDVERDSKEGYADYTIADLDADFAEGDLDKAQVRFVYTDKDGNSSYDAPDSTGTYTVKVEFGGDVMNNYTVEKVDGTLIITERKVLVTPVFIGTDDAYNGSAMAFWYSDVHNVEGAAGEKGFAEDDPNVDNFEVKFTYTDENGVTHEGTPVNAGTYTVEVTISGAGVEQYSISYEPITFTVKKRELSYKVEVDGTKSFVYNKLRPELDVNITATGFADGEGDDCDYELYIGNKVATRYDVGTYEVRIKFAGMQNYDITAITDEIKITPRTIVVTPVDRYNGVPQVYDGNNLKLREDRDFVINSKELENGDLAEGDTLTIQSTEIAPTAPSGDLKIVNVFINDADGDVKNNYTVISSYNRNNAIVKQLGLQLSDFQKRVSYVKTEITYTLGDVGESYSYTGATRVHEFDDKAISLSNGTLFAGHRLAFSKNSVNVPAAADRYEDLITKLVCVVDGDGNRLAIYDLVCGNPENGVITVTKTVVSVDLSGLSVSDLTVGELNRTVTFEGENPTVCAYEVRAFMLDDKWLIGVMLFNETSGRRADLSANYELNAACTLDGAEVKIITLNEAAEYGLPEIKVEITVDDIDGLYEYDGASRWVLDSGYTVTGGDLLTANGHKLQVLVFREGGSYVLGVTIYSEDDKGLRTEAGSNYRVVVKSEISARYVTMSEISTMQREIYLDFSNAINEEDGTLNTELVTISGLNKTDDHQVEMTLESNGDGTYTVKVNIYQLRRMGSSYLKVNMTERYELHWVAPDCVTDVVKA